MSYNSDHFDLTRWRLTLPTDCDGEFKNVAQQVKSLTGFEDGKYFYDAKDGAMILRAPVEGATTSGSKYARSELREMNGSEEAAWKLSEGGTMSATLKINKLPVGKGDDEGHQVIGQIHGEDDELVRLYYTKGGKITFVNDQAGKANSETELTLLNAKGQQTSISLGEKFSYMIDVHDGKLTIKISADDDTYSSVTTINSVWNSDRFYFKAGVYLGNNESNGSGEGETAFYALDYSHTKGKGLGGWQTDTDESVPVKPDSPEKPASDDSETEKPPVTPKTIYGDDHANTVQGSSSDDVLNGKAGDDALRGGSGDDLLWGSDGADTLSGGFGSDTLKGGNGADAYVIDNGANVVEISDFSVSNGDRVSFPNFLELQGITPSKAVEKDYISWSQNGKDINLYLDLDGRTGDLAQFKVAVLKNVDADDLTSKNFMLPKGEPVIPAPYDLVSGGKHDDDLSGSSSDNLVKGYNGDDYILDNYGDDTLIGGLGDDTLKGGAGDDVFVFETLNDGVDRIREFEVSDKLDFVNLKTQFRGSNLDANALVKQGYVTFDAVSKTTTDLYVDADGKAGSSAKILLAHIETDGSYHFDASDLLF